MEDDDDEFGDLYTDVLRTFPSSASADQPPPSSLSSPPLDLLIDLNPQDHEEELMCKVPDSKEANQTLVLGAPTDSVVVTGVGESGGNSDKLADGDVDKDEYLAGVSVNLDSPKRSEPRALESGGEENVNGASDDREGGDKPCVDVVKDEGDDRGDVSREKCDSFDAQEGDTGIGDVGLEPIIPGLLIPGAGNGVENAADVSFLPREDVSAEGDDWDSDSEDDLQIVLNDNTHGPMAMDGVGVASDEEDEDGEPLVILADDDPNHQQMEDQEWGEDAVQSTDADRKDIGEAGKVNGKTAIAPKIGYSSHGYHPFHSQFKYVRPGAALMPGNVSGGPAGGIGQVRPLGTFAGRGRGDWRPTGIKAASSLQENFHSGYGMPWGNNVPGRGFGGGLEFTLPSHKTIFDVDIDGFEEKPWKLPGVDISDFFNFGLNEDSWKDYCKRLEQLRLEATMQSKIRVYESGRTEHEYDPDLPPELAAAVGIHDATTENANTVKQDAGQGDIAKGSSRVRPPLPTGRAIQVESGYSERLPSIDTRPPRIRDSDAIIEIVLQDSIDDDPSSGNDVLEQPANDIQRVDFSAVQDENAHADPEFYDDLPLAHNGRKMELVGKSVPFNNIAHDSLPEGDGDEPTQYHLGSRAKTSVYGIGDYAIPNEERRTSGIPCDRSPLMSPSRSSRDKRYPDNENEGSVESIDGKHSKLSSSPVTSRVAEEQRDDHKIIEPDEHILADGNSQVERDDMTLDRVDAINTLKDEDLLHPVKKQKLSSRVEQPVIQEVDDAEDMNATSSENSKAKSGSSKDYQRRRDGTEEEVLLDEHSTHIGDTKRQLDEDESTFRRNDRNARQEIDMAVKGREESYPSSAHYLHMKNEALDSRKRDAFDGAWQKRDENPHSRRNRDEDARMRERGDEMGSRHKGKLKEIERSDKVEHANSRKLVDSGSWRGHRVKELGSRHKERDDNLKSQYDNVGDLHSKRRKDEEYPRRESADKEEVLRGYREITNLRKRERNEISDLRKKDDQGRIRENPDDRHSVRHKDDGWFQRERSERQSERERDEWHRVKPSHEVNLSRREREEGRGAVRSARGAEDKGWVIHARVKDDYSGSDKDYPIKDTGRHSEQHKRRDHRIEDESIHRVHEDVYARGSQFSSEDRKSRQERSSTRNDRVGNQRMLEKKHKENTRKSKETESGGHNTSLHTKGSREDLAGRVTVSLKGTSEQRNNNRNILQSSRKRKEDASSDDEQQDSRRGRSKLERWTSHKERDYSVNTKSSTSLRVKEINSNNNGQSSFASKLPRDSLKAVEAVDNRQPLAEARETDDLEMKDADTKPMEDRHLDTAEKLKKRSERFKLPMPIEKDPVAIKNTEKEALPSVQSEAPADSAIKQERPARKRRWIGN